MTWLCTINRDGSDFYVFSNVTYASHYNWRDNGNLVIWASVNGTPGMYLLADQNREAERLAPDFFDRNLHCVYSPDRQYILGDSYPDSGDFVNGYRRIYLFNTKTGEGSMLIRLKSDPAATADIRCDLHNRWSPDGRTISLDSTHEGYRGLYVADVDGVRR